MLEHIFLCDKQTPFAFPVVPDVNNKIRNSSGSISILSKSVKPFKYKFLPSSLNEENKI